MKNGLLAYAILVSTITSTSAFAGACYPNSKEFGGSDILKQNWPALRSIGLTKELQPSGMLPITCHQSKGFRNKAEVSSKQKCVFISDYGVGSFDPVRSDYCKHNSYTLVLFEETPIVWRVYGGAEGIREFDKSGNPVALSTSASAVPDQTDASATFNKATPSSANPVDDIVKKGLGGVLKGFMR